MLLLLLMLMSKSDGRKQAKNCIYYNVR